MRWPSRRAASCRTPRAGCRERLLAWTSGLQSLWTQAAARQRQRRAVVDPRCGAARVGGPHFPRTSHQRRQNVRGLAGPELVMHETVDAAIHLRGIRCLVHRREIARVNPVLLHAELLTDTLV